jgi:hypothetical protein
MQEDIIIDTTDHVIEVKDGHFRGRDTLTLLGITEALKIIIITEEIEVIRGISGAGE